MSVRLCQKGIIESLPDGKYDLDACRTRYIRHLRSRPPRGESQAKLLDARARLAQLKFDERAHRLIETEGALDALTQIVGTVLVELVGLVPAIAGKDVRERRRIEDLIFQMRVRVSGQLKAQADALRATGKAA